MKKLLISFIVVIVMFFSVFLVHAQAVDFDFGGATVKLADSADLSEQFEEGEGLAYLNSIKEQFNVEIEFIQLNWSQIASQLGPSVMAGDPFADAFKFSHRNLWAQINQGYLLPLNDALEEIDYYNRLPEVFQESTKAFGDWFGLTFGYGIQTGKTWGVIWNKSLFEREGLPDLYELQDSGDWTWDMFYEIAEEVTQDTTGDGQTDLWGIGGDRFTPDMWLKTNDEHVLTFEDGKPLMTMDNEGSLETFNFMAKIYQNGLKFTGQDARNKAYNGEIAMFVEAPNVYRRRPADLQDEFGFVTMPKGPQADRHVGPERGQTRQWRIPKGTEFDPAALVELTSALDQEISPYGDIDRIYDDIVELFAMSAADFESILSFETTIQNTAQAFYWGAAVSNSLAAAFNGDISVAAAVERGIQADQARMEDVYEAFLEAYADWSEYLNK